MVERLTPVLFIYFFKNEDGRKVTTNGTRYHAMITNYLLSEIQARYVGDI